MISLGMETLTLSEACTSTSVGRVKLNFNLDKAEFVRFDDSNVTLLKTDASPMIIANSP